MLKTFFSYYRPYRALFLLDFGCAVVAGLLELGFPLAVKVYIDRLLPSADWALIVAAALALLAVYLLSAGLNAIVVYFGHMLGINIETELRRRSFDHLQKLSFRYFDNQKSGHLVARLTKDLEEIGEIAHHGPEDLFIAVMTFIGAFLLMLSVNTELALITTAIVPAVAFITARYGGRMTENWHQLYGRVAGFNVRIEENVGGMRVVQAFANEDHERRLFAVDNSAYRTTKLAAYRLMAATNALSFLSMRLVQLVVLIAGSRLVLTGDLTAGGFVGFLLLVGVFFRPVEKINAVIETYPKGIAGFRRYLEFLGTEPDIADRPNAIVAPPFKGHVRFSDVGFSYGGDRPLLSGINLDIASGETIAFVGPSGVGKTTLCSLLPRFYEVTEGAISIDGIDIRNMTVASLRRQIGIVQQDVFLFGGTIRENIAYGRLDATESEIAAAAERAQLGSLLSDLPDGLDTIVGERGVKLSGGQKQRIAIARMFLKDPPILILDEATSALDTATEREIQASLAELAKGRTSLVIAHRLSTIRNAHRIVVVDADGIAEQGSHDDLLKRGGGYARLYAAGG
ncbi:Putative multidrug export ATP-binding/permease protein [Pleomorphomonas sp. T1.2MG-36]|uniref:ABC transporter ATP-binding protein n=1 Tax=Pleomorphomonas sp. T1.2MG-36 TaxID=3041167 RepID=UPI0024777930|nr:ABC transporter ATP-binding protein [Pleomorphomonas sp. T1.2MG-36]CAI9412779.1 Putative multidrug export ATP-binding/permease protein [Pleomorphomonas sp. T1.2MG-36]